MSPGPEPAGSDRPLDEPADRAPTDDPASQGDQPGERHPGERIPRRAVGPDDLVADPGDADEIG